ncbi:bifunctional epoxide hydrolase 2 isoform X2 [Protopterus annectens]|uniref:bifunctional epoxide hydrolase 2 isoform X2 n=1 Tax=Protopterus annectens TaxID=7888 RepID=UPI001CF9BC57|nr:bifunctional epoxide hydrolase 2 isoform X2 [Protopterus annectens]
MAGRKFVLFDLGGVLLTPRPHLTFQKYEESINLPRGFIQNVILKDPNSSFFQAERGHLRLSELIPKFESECQEFASTSGISLPPQFSVHNIFEAMFSAYKLNKSMLQAAITLKNNGFKTCVLTNNILDDTDMRATTGQVLCMISRHFDVLIESCRVGLRKPDLEIYNLVLKALQMEPQQGIFLDDIGANLKPAKKLGMATILVRETEDALKELQTISGVQLLNSETSLPAMCHPESVSHAYVSIKPGVRIHYVDMGDGPAVCLFHGFPESWFSWRYQIPALVDAGFRVLALDMKGYGESTAPSDIEEYSQEEICKDLVVFLNRLGISQATLIGHDWGGSVVWNMSLFYPERVRAVAGVNTPFFHVNPLINPFSSLEKVPVFDYQFYFQEPGVAEAELEANLERTFRVLIRGSSKQDMLKPPLSTANVRQRGGLLVGSPENPPPSHILPEAELQYYIQQFKKTGFRGPLNWYRNIEKNWCWGCSAAERKVLVPALMVTAGKDSVLTPSLSAGMEKRASRAE